MRTIAELKKILANEGPGALTPPELKQAKELSEEASILEKRKARWAANVTPMPGAAGVAIGKKLGDFQQQCFDGIADILGGRNEAAKATMIKMLFEATGMLRPPPPDSDKPIEIELDLTGVDPDADVAEAESHAATG
jgi:hypothetical protein